MKKDRRLRSLERLALLRERQIDVLSADMGSRHAVQRRFRGNIERLETLYQSSGASSGDSGAHPAPSSALSLNCADYKQAVMKMADAHRGDLALHEADMAVARRALAGATRRQEALGKALERVRKTARDLRSARERKLQDEIAIQIWDRGRK
jgi:flagellar export protein FliJ